MEANRVKLDATPPPHKRSALQAWMQIAPLSPVAIGLILGVVVESVTVPPLAVGNAVFIVAGLAAFSAWMRRRAAPLLILFASAGAGITLHHAAARIVRPDSVELLARPDGPIVRLRGVVVSAPIQKAEPDNPFRKWIHVGAAGSFLLQVESAEGEDGRVPVSGRVRVTVSSAVLDLAERDRVEVFGRLYALSPPSNPGATDWRAYFRRQGVFARMNCDGRRNVVKLQPGPAATQDVLNWLRGKTRELLVDDVAVGASEESTLLEAMILGHRSRFDRRLNEIFTRAGVIHFIAVSGTHMVVLMSFVWLVGRVLRRTKRQCTALMVVAILLYVCVAEPRPPILRATVMGLLFCAALWMGRARAHLNWLSAAAILLIVIDPQTVFDVGFQLSFAAVLAVAYLAPAIMNALRALTHVVTVHFLGDPYAKLDASLADAAARDRGNTSPSLRKTLRRWGGGLLMALAVSVAAWLVALPIVVLNFHALQPWGPVSTVLVFPLMSLVMVLGLAKVLLASVSQIADSALGAVLGVLDRWLIDLVEALSKLPGSGTTIATPPWWVVSIYYVTIMALVVRFRVSRRGEAAPIGPWRTWTLIASLLGLGIGVAAWTRSTQLRDELTVTALSVGRGSATVLELPDGRAILYDAGSSFASDPATAAIIPFLCHQGVSHLDRLFVSHPNLDHFSGVPTVLARIPTGPVILNDCFEGMSKPRSASAYLLHLLDEQPHPVEVLDAARRKWKEGEVEFEVLWPDATCDPTLSANDASTVLRVRYAGHSILFTGDIEKRAQQELLKRGDLHADVLFLPHHGSVEPTTKAFIEAVRPTVAVRSSSERTADTVNGLERLLGDIPVYNTAELGAIEVTLRRDGIEIACPQAGTYSSRVVNQEPLDRSRTP